ncbi:hypothetical protein CVV38_03890 [Candidatus Peregrinibacteria bacterium HGW-Peregrinibacteria-1]|jgi:hypothetical protein|nr:MAG: hypothetical protein CVV38_03890 [Candidatus Peregrinibacteria bacterium HGW-Peregrinibacteria-1]
MSRRYNNYSGGVGSRRKSGSNSVGRYLFPFVVLIAVGVIAVLLFNLWKVFFGDDTNERAYLHIVSGSVDVKQWGTDDFFTLNEDVLLLEGDMVRTGGGSKSIIEFVDGTIVRVDENSEIELALITNGGRDSKVSVKLNRGGMWVNKTYKSTVSEFVVDSGFVDVVVPGVTNFSVDNAIGSVTTRVYTGDDITVNILGKDGGRAVETERMTVGQEAVFTDEVLDKYWQYQSPNVISPFSDGVRVDDWYMWNIAEDRNPTEFVVKADDGQIKFVEVMPVVFEEDEELNEEDAGDGEMVDGVEGGENELGEEGNGATKEVEEPVIEISTVSGAKPVLSSVSGIKETNAEGFYVVTSQVAEIMGTVSNASKIVVNGYTLQQFKEGDTSWKYYANAAYAHLMKPGENVYEIYSVSSEGVESEKLIVKVFYQPASKASNTSSENSAGGAEGSAEEAAE